MTLTPPRDAPAVPPARLWRRLGWLAALAALVLALGAGRFGYDRLHAAALDLSATRAQNTLSLAVAALNGQLRRYDRLPGLIAQQPVIRALLFAPQGAAEQLAANIYLRETARLLQASDIYVMGLDGTTLAASNFDRPRSFVGGNFAFRPYFLDALSRGEGRFYALGTTSGVRGYYFGAPVLIDDSSAGVLAVKIDLDAIEQSWRGSDYEVIVTDPESIVFMSTHPDWAFGATEPLTQARLARTRATRRYAEAEISALNVTRSVGPGGADLWQVGGAGNSATEYLVVTQLMPEADWSVRVLVNTAGARQQALIRLAVAGLLAVLGVLAVVVIVQRRLRLRERMALQAEARAQLERRVDARTAELAAVNTRLGAEVVERTAAEARLRTTQAELVQAGKLAALGQMSAALSHEFNQPLGAARNFAENAQLLIERGRIAEASGNIERILALIGRMGELSRHLRNFARKPNAQLSDVSLSEAIAAVQEILGWRFRALDVTLHLEVAPLQVRAGQVRLQQVLVNILANALDALEGAARREITLTVHRDGDRAVLTIADTGPGIAPQLLERIFDPFFSTKGVGKGLGLGLSISYNIVHDFGGSLAVANGSTGGAVFTLTLPLAQSARHAA